MVDIYNSDVEASPLFNGLQDIGFRLFTRNNPNAPQIIGINNHAQLAASHFNPSHQTRFMIHGWLGGGDDDNGIYIIFFFCHTVTSFNFTGLPIMSAFLNRDNFNFFMVDWSIGAATPNYILARSRVNEVGAVVAQFIDFLNQPLSVISVIGHSLGAHAAVSLDSFFT